MKIWRRVSSAILILLFVFSVTSCSVGENSNDATDTSNTSNVQGVSSVSNGSFNYDTVCQRVKLGDEEIPVPFTVKDLGSGYSIDYSNVFYTTNSDGTLNAAFDIKRNGMRVLDAQIHNLPSEYKDKNLDDFEINLFTQTSSNSLFFSLTVDDIGNGTDISEVVKAFGESQETTTNGTGGAYRYYRNGDKKYGITFFYEDDTIYSIMYKYNKRLY